MILTKKRIYLSIAFVWILSIALSLVGIVWRSIEQQTLKDDKKICELINNVGFALFSASISFYIPLLFILIIYFRIYKEARKQMKFLITGTKTSKTDDHGNDVTLRVHIGPSNKNKVCTCRMTSFKDRSSHDKMREQSNFNSNNFRSLKNEEEVMIKKPRTLKSTSFDLTNISSNTPSKMYCPVCSQISNNSLAESKIFSSNTNISFSSKVAKFKKEQKAAKTLAIVIGKGQNIKITSRIKIKLH